MIEIAVTALIAVGALYLLLVRTRYLERERAKLYDVAYGPGSDAINEYRKRERDKITRASGYEPPEGRS